MWFLDTVLNPGLIAVRFVQSDHRFINLKRMLALWIPVWREKTRLSSSEVRGSWLQTLGANLAVPSIAVVINSVNGDTLLEFTEPNCTIFSLYEFISLWEKHKDCSQLTGSFVIFPCKFNSVTCRCDWNDKNRLKCKMTYYGKRKVAIRQTYHLFCHGYTNVRLIFLKFCRNDRD